MTQTPTESSNKYDENEFKHFERAATLQKVIGEKLLMGIRIDLDNQLKRNITNYKNISTLTSHFLYKYLKITNEKANK